MSEINPSYMKVTMIVYKGEGPGRTAHLYGHYNGQQKQTTAILDTSGTWSVNPIISPNVVRTLSVGSQYPFK